MNIIETIKNHLGEGELEQALFLLQSEEPDSVVLMQQFKSTERSYNLGIIEFKEYSMMRNKVAYAINQFLEDIIEKNNVSAKANPVTDLLRNPVGQADSTFVGSRTPGAQSDVPMYGLRETVSEKKWVAKAKNVVVQVYAGADKSELMRFSNPFYGLRKHEKVGAWKEAVLHEEESIERSVLVDIEKADVLLLFVSDAFLKTISAWIGPLSVLMERQRQGTVLIQLIYLKKCDWSNAPFAHLQALPSAKTALWSYSDVDKPIKKIASTLTELIESDVST